MVEEIVHHIKQIAQKDNLYSEGTARTPYIVLGEEPIRRNMTPKRTLEGVLSDDINAAKATLGK